MSKVESSENIRINDKDGKLIEAGYCWTESSGTGTWFNAAAIFVPIASFIYSIGTFDLSSIVVGFIASPILFLLGFKLGSSRRSVIFSSDGRILIPQGLPPVRRGEQFIEGNHSNISSIEVAPAIRGGGSNGVTLVSKSGDTVYVALSLYQGEARKVAVMLTQALEDIRKSLASSNESIRATPSTSSMSPRRIID